jgi:hypothetical protein
MAQRKAMSRRAGNDSQQLDFARPDRSGNTSAGRQRFIPSFTAETTTPAADNVSDFFSDDDFKARWWPAPDGE